MAKSFATITEDNLVSEWAKFLEIQAKLCIKKDIDVMSRMGLVVLDKPILDLGCGVGAYTVELKKYFPESKIIATDINKDLLEMFKDKLDINPDPSIEIFHWDSRKETVPSSVKNCRTCIVRMVLQHVPDPKAVLDSLRSVLPKGANVFVIEEDDGFFQIYPEFPEFNKLINTWKKYGTKYVNTRCMGRQLPYLLSEAGFHVSQSEVVGHTNLDWGMDNMTDFFIGTLYLIHASDPEMISLEEIEQIKKGFIEHSKKYQNSCFIIYPQVITVGEIL